jgi:hypothetical protein
MAPQKKKLAEAGFSIEDSKRGGSNSTIFALFGPIQFENRQANKNRNFPHRDSSRCGL